MDRSKAIIRTSLAGVVTNLLLAAFKAIVGVLSGSVAILMDAVNNLSDMLSSVITIIGTRLSQRPADRKHPFGHGRLEYFTAIVISVIVLGAGISSLIESVKHLFHPGDLNYSTLTLVVVSVAVIVKLLLGRYVKAQGKKLSSDALIASGSDALFDAVITLSTLISAAIMIIWRVSVDGYLGVIISCFIIKSGIEMLASPVNELLGTRISPEFVRQIKADVMKFEGVHGVFDIIMHNYGPNVIIGSLHINVHDTMGAEDIHRLTRRISEYLAERYGIVMTIGIYSVATGGNCHYALQNAVLQVLSRQEHVTQVHGFCYFEQENRISVDVVPDLSIVDDQAYAQQLTALIKEIVPDRQVTVVIDHNYS